MHACAALMEELLANADTHSTYEPATATLFHELMASSLWGNATDLSLLTHLAYADVQKLQTTNAEQRAAKKEYVLADDLDKAWATVRSMRHGRIDIVLDNAGFELATDLLLAEWLLTLRGTLPRPTDERARDVQQRVAAVHTRIAKAANEAVCSTQPGLLAVSKLQPPSDVMAAYDAGQRHFGENYAQELAEKAHVLPRDIRWHLIGALQSNKAKVLGAIPNLYAVESVDSEKLATHLEKALAKPENERGRTYPLSVYLQVNTSGETGKSGVLALDTDDGAATSALGVLARHILLHCPHLRLAGLMTIGALANSQKAHDEHRNPDFEALVRTRELLLRSLRSDTELLAKLEGASWWTCEGPCTDAYSALLSESDDALALSMGMSADLEAAIAYGSAHVRIGSDCFGPRSTAQDAAAVRAGEIDQAAHMPLVDQVVFHPKNMPWFVSDTCVTDVQTMLEKLQDPAFFADAKLASTAPIESMGARWASHFAQGAFRLEIPQGTPLGAETGPLSSFWTRPESYGAMVGWPTYAAHARTRAPCSSSAVRPGYLQR